MRLICSMASSHGAPGMLNWLPLAVCSRQRQYGLLIASIKVVLIDFYS
jgi:hypothetical protein